MQAWFDDWEVESFTRYRIDNFDNNNNGFVDIDNNTATHAAAERMTLATELEESIHSLSGLAIPEIKRSNPNLTYSFLYEILTAPPRFDSEHGDGFADDIDTKFQSEPESQEPLDLLATSEFDEHGFLVTSISYNTNQLTRSTYNRGVILERVIRYRPATNPNQPLKNTYLDFYFGTRYIHCRDSQTFFGISPLVGSSIWATAVDNEKVGPHIGGQWVLTNDDWELQVCGTVQYALDYYHSDQFVKIGSGSLPTNLPSPWWIDPVNSSTTANDRGQSLLSEFRLRATHRLNARISLSVGYTVFSLGEIRNAGSITSYNVNDLGLRKTVGQSVSAGTAFVSFDLLR